MKTVNIPVHVVKLIVDNKEIDEMVASAAISLNPHVTWMKLVLTDDMPNANKQKIPRSEFANVLRTGVFMPLKMGYGEITDGHPNTFPIGTFAHLKTEANTIEALVALWNREREDDVDFLKERYETGKSIDVSWEVSYTDEKFDESDSSSALLNISMNGAVIVGMPAYEGRTPVIALSSENKESTEQEGDNSEMDEKEYTTKIQELETQVADLKSKLSDSEAQINEMKPKYEVLAAFKANYDVEQEKASKIQLVKDKFSGSKLNITEEYLNDKLDTLVAMSEEQLDFFVQELSAFSAERPEGDNDGDGEASVSLTSSNIPNVRSQSNKVTKESLVEFLQKLD
jgi:hypothetical protein